MRGLSGNRSVSLSGLARQSGPLDDAIALRLLGVRSPGVADSRLRDVAQLPLSPKCGGTLAAHGFQNIVSSSDLNMPSPNQSMSSTSCPNELGFRDAVDDAGAGNQEQPVPRERARQERIAAFEAQRRQHVREQDANLRKLLKDSHALARPSSADPYCSAAKQERIAAYEAQRRKHIRKQDATLRKLLKVGVAEVRPTSGDPSCSAAKRRAEYEIKRKADIKIRFARAEEARKMIVDRLQELQAPVEVVRHIIHRVLSAAGMDEYGGIESGVTMDMIDAAWEKYGIEFYMPKMRELLVTSPMRDDLLDVISKDSQPWTWLNFLRSSLAQRALGEFHSVSEFVEHIKNTNEFSCQICSDQMISLSGDDCRDIHCNFWSPTQRQNEHWRNDACGHAFCRACVTKWAETAINDQKLQIKCPAAGCKYRLWDQDLQELLSIQMFKRHQEHKQADHLSNLANIVKHDDCLLGWLRTHARPCPDCHVIVSRSEGCNTMVCVCGTRFCYACGFKKCQCGREKHQVADIWEPMA